VTITPTATTSKVLIQFSVNTQLAATTGNVTAALKIMRSISGGAASQVIECLQIAQASATYPVIAADQSFVQFLDSPNTVGTCVYQLQIKVAGDGSLFCNAGGGITTMVLSEC
jgi:hypothetical protein